MKTTLLALCFLCTSAAFAQSGGTASLTNGLQFANHTVHAAPQPMGQVNDLLDGSSVVVAQGERPIGEVVPEAYEMPLGDAARILKKEHASAKKAQFIWETSVMGGPVKSPVR